MNRSTPMKRTGFKSRLPPRRDDTQTTYTPKPRAAAVAIHDGKARMVVSVPKEAPARDETYRRLVAALPCAHCQRHGPSQCAHPDFGKGLGIKADDYGCFPLCADDPGRRGCHSLIGDAGLFTKAMRRALETTYGLRTREQLAHHFDGAMP